MSERGQSFPAISALQQPLWVLYKANPTDPANEHVLAVEVQGDFDVARGEQALRTVLSRHVDLYTTFRLLNSAVIRIPFDPARAVITKKRAAAGTPMEVLAGLLEEVPEPEIAPAIGITLATLGSGKLILLFRAHRLLLDRSSFARFLDAYCDQYEYAQGAEQAGTGRTGRAARSAPDASDVARAFANLPDEPAIPDDFPFTLSRRRTSAVDVPLLPALTERASRPGRETGGSELAVWLAAYASLLHAYSGSTDLVIGVPWSTAGRGELAQATNVVPVRIRIDEGEQFAALCSRVSGLLMEAASRCRLPFAQLCRELGIAGSTADTPLIHSSLRYQRVSPDSRLSRLLVPDAGPCRLGESILTRLYLRPEDRLTRFDVDILSSADSLLATVRYDPSSIAVERALSLARHLHVFLDRALDNPQLPLRVLDYLPDDERERVGELGRPETKPLNAAPAWQTIAEVASRFPDQVAIRRRGNELTYAALWRRVEAAAALLAASGAECGERVALIAEPSADLVVWMLAIHRAGCAYLPLDTATPAQRVADILDDAGCRIVITDRTAAGTVAVASGRRVIQAGDAPPDIDQAAPDTGISLDDIAYVIYTSGSTGRPKGVLVPQRGLKNHCEGVIDAFGLQSTDRVLQFASPSFDVAAEEVFPTLAAGATLVLRDSLGVAPSVLCDLAAAEKITVLNLPTSYWVEWVKWLLATGRPIPATVRLVIIGGEEVLPSAVRQWFALGSQGVRLINAYGPTETTISPVLGEVLLSDIEHGQRVPIGRPLPNIGVAVVDRSGRPVGTGIPGELIISGPCVAAGYLGQPEKASESFHGDDPSTRSYRTGDVVRWRFDGKLEFIGRNDCQVQVRGFRVELAEIEAKLLEHPAVSAAAVVCEGAGTESASLIGWVSASAGREIDEAEIRSWLAASLPYYMVPNRIVSTAALPVTTSGKIDRKKLLADLAPNRALVAEAPIGPEEEALADIWKSVLAIEDCDRMAGFIDQGGHSIRALEVIEKAAAVFVSPPGLDSLLSDTLAQVASGLELKSTATGSAMGKRSLPDSRRSVASIGPRITPLLTGDATSPVYAVHYEPPAAVPNRGAVLICPPYGHEYVRTHRAVTRLCEALSRAGCHALKFDYFGTGDSAGDSGAGGIDRWIDDIRCAADELVRRSGAANPHVIGLRLGAMLAMATPVQAASAVWVDPVVSGCSYVDELERLERRLRASSDSLVIPGKATDLVGIPWPAALRSELRDHSVGSGRRVTFDRQCCVLSDEYTQADIDELRCLLGATDVVRPGFETPWRHLSNRAEELISRDVIAGISAQILGQT